MKQNHYQLRTGNFIRCWGVPSAIHERNNLGKNKFAILEFAPQKEIPFWRYATNGMSEAPQTAGKNIEIRTELIAIAEKSNDWVLSLLDALAKYPFAHNTFFSPYDTVAVGQSIDRSNSSFEAVMLIPCSFSHNLPIQHMADVFREPISILQAVGIWESECEIARERGGEYLFQLLATYERLALDADRQCVV